MLKLTTAQLNENTLLALPSVGAIRCGAYVKL